MPNQPDQATHRAILLLYDFDLFVRVDFFGGAVTKPCTVVVAQLRFDVPVSVELEVHPSVGPAINSRFWHGRKCTDFWHLRRSSLDWVKTIVLQEILVQYYCAVKLSTVWNEIGTILITD